MHILATQIATLDEAETAVDLAQSPGDVVVMSFSDSDLSALAAAWEAEPGLPSLRLADLKRLRHPMSVDLYVEQVVRHAKAVVLRCLGGLEYWRYGLERIAAVAKARGILLAALPGDDRPDPRLAELSTLPRDALDRLDRYFRSGGPGNLRHALRYLAALQGAPLASDEPQALGPIVRFDPDGGSTFSPEGDLPLIRTDQPSPLAGEGGRRRRPGEGDDFSANSDLEESHTPSPGSAAPRSLLLQGREQGRADERHRHGVASKSLAGGHGEVLDDGAERERR